STVYVTASYVTAYAFERLSGTFVWGHPGALPDRGITAALFDDKLWVHDDTFGGVALDAATGAQVGTFVSMHTPAFGDDVGVFVVAYSLRAVKISTDETLWDAAAITKDIAVSPIVVNGVVYGGDRAGIIRAFDAATGSVLWSDDVGSPIVIADDPTLS